MLNTKYAPWPRFDEDEIQAVTDVLKSGKVNYWTGDLTKKFESEYAQYHQRKFGIALSNGTLALELALLGFGIGQGDEVITTPRTFIASSSCIVRVGATPVLADINPHSQCIDVHTIKKCLTPKTKAIVVVHLGGWAADMPSIMAFAKEHDLIVIEDCAQAHGAKIQGRLIGSFGHAAAFSFCQDKIISTGGEGGIVILDDEKAYKKMWAFKDHGKDYDTVYHKSHPPGFRWLHESFGTNWRFTEMQSAIGLLQLKKLDGWVQQRRQVAHAIYDSMKGLPYFHIPMPSSEVYHSYYRFYVFLKLEVLKTGVTRDQIVHEIAAQGVPCFVGSCGQIYLEKAFTQSSFAQKEKLIEAEKLAASSMAFLCHPGLGDDYIKELTKVVTEVLEKYSK